MGFVAIRIENVQIFLNENLFIDKLLNKITIFIKIEMLKNVNFCSLLTF